MRASLLQPVGSGCQAAGQERASLNPYQSNRHSTCCEAEEVQIPLFFFHPKPLAAVSGQRGARNPLKGLSLSSCALACAPLPSQRSLCCKENENEGGKQFRNEAGGLKEMGLFIWQKA